MKKLAVILLCAICAQQECYPQASSAALGKCEITRDWPRDESKHPFDTVAAFYRHVIDVYVDKCSYAQGETIQLRAATKLQSLNDADVTVTIRRYGPNDWEDVTTAPDFQLKYRANFTLNQNGQPIDYQQGAGWPQSATIAVGEWQSGFYCIQLTAGEYTGVAPFVVRPSGSSSNKILWVVPMNTYQAYNAWGGSSLYWPTMPNALYFTNVVSFDRPYGETWTLPNFGSDPYSYHANDSLGQWGQREWAWVKWAEDGRYSFDYCADYDLDQAYQTGLLGPYKTIFIPAHSEYWTDNMRANVIAFMQGQATGQSGDNPGNVAFFGANNCYWRTTYIGAGNRQMMVRKLNDTDMYRDIYDPSDGTTKHEAKFIGIEYIDNQKHNPAQKAKEPFHWIFKNSDIDEVDQTFGFGEGYDSIAAGESDDFVQGVSPTNLHVLARTNVTKDDDAGSDLFSTVSYYVNQSTNSRVFACGSLGWHSGIRGSDGSSVGTVVSNVLNHFSGATYADSIFRDIQWDEDIEVFANVFLLAGTELKISGSITITLDANETLYVSGEMKILDGLTVKLAGTGTVFVKSGGKITVGDNSTLETESGSLLAAEQGATFTCGSESGIYAYWKLNINGTSNSPVIFQPASGTSPNSWGGIILDGSGAAYSTLNHAIVQYAYDVECLNGAHAIIQNSLFDRNVCGIYVDGANPWIFWDTIRNPLTHGIVAQGCAPGVFGNTITKESSLGTYHENGGGWYVGAWDYVARNMIKGFNMGVYSTTGSAPDFWQTSIQGERSNLITDCNYGVVTYGDAEIRMGYEDMPSYDSVHDNIIRNVDANDGCTIWAEWNYWGPQPIDSNDFYSAAGATLDTTNSLPTDPWDGYSSPVIRRMKPATESKVLSARGFVGSGLGEADDLLTVTRLIRSGQKLEAINILTSMVKNGQRVLPAISLLRTCFPDSLSAEGISCFSSLKDHAPGATPILNRVLATIQLQRHETQEARALLESNITYCPGTEYERSARLELFYIALHRDKNLDLAGSLLQNLKSIYGSCDDIVFAEDMYNHAVARATHSSAQGLAPGSLLHAEGKKAPIPSAFALGRNYPNPFNPSTRIDYQVKDPSFVRVAIYDILGRKVTELVSSQMQPGYYSCSWNATNSSSGVYIYRMVVTDAAGSNLFTDTKRMLLLK